MFEGILPPAALRAQGLDGGESSASQSKEERAEREADAVSAQKAHVSDLKARI